MRKLTFQNLSILVNKEKISVLVLDGKNEKYVLYSFEEPTIDPNDIDFSLFDLMVFDENLNITPKKRLAELGIHVVNNLDGKYFLKINNKQLYCIKNSKNIVVDNPTLKLVCSNGSLFINNKEKEDDLINNILNENNEDQDKEIIDTDQQKEDINVTHEKPTFQETVIENNEDSQSLQQMEDIKVINVTMPISILPEAVVENIEDSQLLQQKEDIKVINVTMPIPTFPETIVENNEDLESFQQMEDIKVINVTIPNPILPETIVENIEDSQSSQQMEDIKVINVTMPMPTFPENVVENKEDSQSCQLKDIKVINVTMPTFTEDTNEKPEKNIKKHKDIEKEQRDKEKDVTKKREKKETIEDESKESIQINPYKPLIIEKLDENNNVTSRIEKDIFNLENILSDFNKLFSSNNEIIKIDNKTENISKSTLESTRDSTQDTAKEKLELHKKTEMKNEVERTREIEKNKEDDIQKIYLSNINFQNANYRIQTLKLKKSLNLNLSNFTTTPISKLNIINGTNIAMELEKENSSYIFLYMNQKILVNKISNTIVVTNILSKKSFIVKNKESFKLGNYDFTLYNDATLILPVIVSKIFDNNYGIAFNKYVLRV